MPTLYSIKGAGFNCVPVNQDFPLSKLLFCSRQWITSNHNRSVTTCIHTYQVTVASSTDSSPLSVPGLNATVKGLRGNTDYSVTVRAVNGAGDGELSQPLSITTNLGVYPPEIASVTANENTGQYILRINRFKTDFGDIRYGVVT